MSYCRFTQKDSDVYVYANVPGGVICCACRLTQKNEYGIYKDTVCETEKDMLKHLCEHMSMGHKVPKRAIKRLEREMKENMR